MERYITDSIYHNKPWERTVEELTEKRIYRRLAAVIPVIKNENFLNFRILEIAFASQRHRFAPSVFFKKKSPQII